MNAAALIPLKRLPLALVVLLVCLCFTATAIAEQAAAPDGGHRILSCNIRQPLEEDAKAGNGWNDRRELCADVIAAHDGDIVCLQECRANQLAYLKERLPEFDSYALSGPSPEFTPNNAILYDRERYELISAGGFWLSETPHVAGSMSWDCASPRHTTWVHLRERSTGRELRVWNAHLDHMGHVAREEQAKLLVEGISAMDAAGVPQILAGDLNAYDGHPAISVLKAGGFRDTYEAVHGPGDPGFTFHGFAGKRRRTDGPGRKIDWVFTRGEFEMHGASIIRDGRDGRYPSDHYFIAADVSLPE
jgi:endonuclease/exonuclease/phosphatase family metal-dependent hydrolase